MLYALLYYKATWLNRSKLLEILCKYLTIIIILIYNLNYIINFLFCSLCIFQAYSMSFKNFLGLSCKKRICLPGSNFNSNMESSHDFLFIIKENKKLVHGPRPQFQFKYDLRHGFRNTLKHNLKNMTSRKRF